MSDQSSNRPLTSKAVTYKALGGPEVIQFVERTVRAPAAGEVRIEVKAAAVNPGTVLRRKLATTNPIESCLSTVQRVARNVKR